MKYCLPIILFLVSFSHSMSQSEVEWTYAFNTSTEMIEITASLEDGWHLYSMDVDESIGPVATSFSFGDSDGFELVGEVLQPKPIVKYDANFEGDLSFFSETVTFAQKVKATDGVMIDGTVTYMVCNDVMCLPPVDEEFTIMIKH